MRGLIYQADSKHDRLDAQQLASVARMDPLLSPIEHRSRQCRVGLSILRARDDVVSARTRLINPVRRCLRSSGIRVRKCSTRYFKRLALPYIPKELRPALVPVLRTIHPCYTAARPDSRPSKKPRVMVFWARTGPHRSPVSGT